MLESNHKWQDMDGYSKGYVTGYRMGMVESGINTMRIFLNDEKKYQKCCMSGQKPTKELELGHKAYFKLLKSQKNMDILNFIAKYPNISDERLAKKIWSESEYWHG